MVYGLAMTESQAEAALRFLEEALLAAGLPTGDLAGLAEEYWVALAGCARLWRVPLPLVADDPAGWAP